MNIMAAYGALLAILNGILLIDSVAALCSISQELFTTEKTFILLDNQLITGSEIPAGRTIEISCDTADYLIPLNGQPKTKVHCTQGSAWNPRLFGMNPDLFACKRTCALHLKPTSTGLQLNSAENDNVRLCTSLSGTSTDDVLVTHQTQAFHGAKTASLKLPNQAKITVECVHANWTFVIDRAPLDNYAILTFQCIEGDWFHVHPALPVEHSISNNFHLRALKCRHLTEAARSFLLTSGAELKMSFINTIANLCIFRFCAVFLITAYHISSYH